MYDNHTETCGYRGDCREYQVDAITYMMQTSAGNGIPEDEMLRDPRP